MKPPHARGTEILGRASTASGRVAMIADSAGKRPVKPGATRADGLGDILDRPFGMGSTAHTLAGLPCPLWLTHGNCTTLPPAHSNAHRDLAGCA